MWEGGDRVGRVSWCAKVQRRGVRIDLTEVESQLRSVEKI